LHFGLYAKDWWIPHSTNNDVTYTHLYPVRLSMKTITTINQCDFIVIIGQDSFEPGYLYQSKALQRKMLFRLEYEQTKSEINKEQTLTYMKEDWQNEQIMDKLFNYHLKKFIA
ncbi:26457_t:CDS:2, partial [Racocetra persica]